MFESFVVPKTTLRPNIIYNLLRKDVGSNQMAEPM